MKIIIFVGIALLGLILPSDGKVLTSCKLAVALFKTILIQMTFLENSISSAPDLRIRGGHDIDIKDAPYQVLIGVSSTAFCGGAIIDKDVVLTAAHCVEDKKVTHFNVMAGSTFLVPRRGNYTRVANMTWHQSYNKTTSDYDIAILWLATPLVYSDNVQPIEMFRKGEDIPDGELTKVTGWGDTTLDGPTWPRTLQEALIPKISNENCSSAYEVGKITPRMLCAFDMDKDACGGDSGGPLVYNGKLAGLISWGRRCGGPFTSPPGVYTRVSEVSSWVNEMISKH